MSNRRQLLAIALAGNATVSIFATTIPSITESFTSNTDSYWINQNTQVSPNSFGWSNTTFAGTGGSGELGGVFSRVQAADTSNIKESEAVVYDFDIGCINLNDAFSFSGVVRFIGRQNTNTGMRIGFSDDKTTWLGPANFFSILLNAGATPTVQLYDTSGNTNKNVASTASSGGLIPTTGGGAVGTFANSGTPVSFSFSYDPNGNGGLGAVTYQTGSTTPLVVNLNSGDKAKFAQFTHFGIVNPRTLANGTLTEYFDNLTFSSQNPLSGVPTWVAPDNAVWSDSNSWVRGVPNSAGIQADFPNTASDQNVNVDNAFTVGRLNLNSSHRYTLGGTGSITLSVSGDPAAIFAPLSSQTINVPVYLNNDTILSATNGTLTTLTVSNLQPSASTVTITKFGQGIVDVNNLRTGTVSVAGGLLQVLPNGTASGMSRISSLAVASGGTLDLTNNGMVIDHPTGNPATLNNVKSLLATGYATATWVGGGIVSSTAAAVAADSNNKFKTAVGYGEATTLGITSFNGQTIAGDAVLLKYTYSGDANLDGKVNALDFNALASNFGASSKLWTDGDFNYDGTINTLDFTALAANFGEALASPPVGSALTGVLIPEPTLLSAWALGASIAIIRRKRR